MLEIKVVIRLVVSLSSLQSISIFLLDEKFQCDINQGDHSRTSFIEEKLGNVKQIKLYYRFLYNILKVGVKNTKNLELFHWNVS